MYRVHGITRKCVQVDSSQALFECRREYVKDKHIPAALRLGLPKAKGTPQEQAALKHLTERM